MVLAILIKLLSNLGSKVGSLVAGRGGLLLSESPASGIPGDDDVLDVSGLGKPPDQLQLLEDGPVSHQLVSLYVLNHYT